VKKFRKIKNKSWKLIVEFHGEELKDLEAKKGEFEVVEVGGSKTTLIFNGKDVSDLVNDKRRKKLRGIIDEAMADIKSDFEMDEWGRVKKELK